MFSALQRQQERCNLLQAAAQHAALGTQVVCLGSSDYGCELHGPTSTAHGVSVQETW